MNQTTKTLDSDEILELIKNTLDETFECTPPASSYVNETTDLLVDIPMFMVENLDEFLTALEEKIGVGWGEIVGKHLLDDVDYFSKVENIITEVESFVDLLDDDDLIFGDYLGPLDDKVEKTSENFYSFESEIFTRAIDKVKQGRQEFSPPQDRMLNACITANTCSAHLLQSFIGFNYFAEDMKESELIGGARSILRSMHQILAEYEVSEIFSLEKHSKGFSLEFENPVQVKYLHELEATSQMLSVVVSKLLEKIHSDYSERQQTRIGEVADDMQMIFSMCNDVISYSGSSLNVEIKKF